MQVDESDVLRIDARVLKPPTLKYGPNSKQPTIVRGPPLLTWTQSHCMLAASNLSMVLGICKFPAV